MNPDLEIYNLFIKHGIPVPERCGEKCNIEEYSEYYDGWICECGAMGSWHDIDDGHNVPYPSYSTDELIDRIIPTLIDKWCIFTIKPYGVGYIDQRNDGAWLYVISLDLFDINQALKQLLIWALENYPQQVKLHLERSE
jgi:hypothetical protein